MLDAIAAVPERGSHGALMLRRTGAARRSHPATVRIRRMTDSIPAPVAALLDTANAHDTEAFLATFTADGVVDDWGREFAGADAIRGWSDAEFIGVRVTLAVTGVEHDGDTTVITAQVGGDGFNGPSHFAFAVAGDKVARMTIRA
jgi:ketosteroid isomerase-like protein